MVTLVFLFNVASHTISRFLQGLIYLIN